jgi:hypothetical protein
MRRLRSESGFSNTAANRQESSIDLASILISGTQPFSPIPEKKRSNAKHNSLLPEKMCTSTEDSAHTIFKVPPQTHVLYPLSVHYEVCNPANSSLLDNDIACRCLPAPGTTTPAFKGKSPEPSAAAINRRSVKTVNILVFPDEAVLEHRAMHGTPISLEATTLPTRLSPTRGRQGVSGRVMQKNVIDNPGIISLNVLPSSAVPHRPTPPFSITAPNSAVSQTRCP